MLLPSFSAPSLQIPEPGPRSYKEDTTDALEMICVVPLLSDPHLSHSGPMPWKLLLILLGKPSCPDYNLRLWKVRAVRMPCTPPNIKNTEWPYQHFLSNDTVLRLRCSQVHILFPGKVWKFQKHIWALREEEIWMHQRNAAEKSPWGRRGGGPGSRSCQLAKPKHSNSCSEAKV